MKKLFYIAPIIFLVVLVIGLPRIIKINYVICHSQAGFCSSFITEKLTGIAGKSFAEAKLEARKILSKELFVASFSVHYNVPDKLVIDVIERKAVISLSYDGSRWWTVDRDGIVIGNSETTNLPALKIEGAQASFTTGAKLPERLLFASDLLERLNYTYQITYARVTPNAIEVQLPSGLEVVFPSEGDKEVLMGSLSLLLSQLKSDSGYSIIDLRYKNPVLK